jgi:hypothetical protein
MVEKRAALPCETINSGNVSIPAKENFAYADMLIVKDP